MAICPHQAQASGYGIAKITCLPEPLVFFTTVSFSARALRPASSHAEKLEEAVGLKNGA